MSPNLRCRFALDPVIRLQLSPKPGSATDYPNRRWQRRCLRGFTPTDHQGVANRITQGAGDMKAPQAETIGAIALVGALGLVGSAMVSPWYYGRQCRELQATPPVTEGDLMQSSQQAPAGGNGGLARWLQDKRVRDITGRGLYSRAGTWLGKIDKVVLDIVTAEPMAVATVGVNRDGSCLHEHVHGHRCIR
jgi:hypothetical protein